MSHTLPGQRLRRHRPVARTATALGGIVAIPALAVGAAQFYRVSSAKLGPGAVLLAIPKVSAGSLAPFAALAGSVGAAFGVSALWPRRGTSQDEPSLTTGLVVLSGLTAAVLNTLYSRQVLATRADFGEAFGADWEQRIPPQLKDRMLARRWTWVLPTASGARVERDVPFATVPGTDRTLLADLWRPPDDIPSSGLGFIYFHGGGYTAFDKGGPTETWFRHLAAQGHIVMDVSYRLIPETNVPGMQGDVKRAIAWLKRNADRYGIDPQRIVLGGGSGGSHLALLAAYAPYYPRFTPEDVRDQDLSVRGVVGYYLAGDYRPDSHAPEPRTALERSVGRLLTSLLARWSGKPIAVDDTGNWDPALLVGGRPDEWPELVRQISPIVHVCALTPPTLQLVGEHDVYLSKDGRELALHRELRAAGVASVYVEYPRTDHAFDLFLPRFSPAAQAAMYEVDRFLGLMASPVGWTAEPRARQVAFAG